MTLADIAGLDYEDRASSGASTKRLRDIKLEWKRLVKFFGDCDPREITRERIRAFEGHWRAKNKAGQSIVRDLQALKRGLNIAHERGGLLELPPFPRVKRSPKNRRKAGKLHQPDKLAAWFAQLKSRVEHYKKDGPKKKHAREAFLEARLALLTGMRAEELDVARVEWRWAAPEGFKVPSFIDIPAECSKSSEDRVVALSNEANEIWNELAGERTEGPLLSGSDHKKVRRWAAEAIGYSPAPTLRDLRHTYMTTGGRGDVVAAAKAAGHTDLRTQQHYQHASLESLADVSLRVAESLAPKSSPAKGGTGGGGTYPERVPESERSIEKAVEIVGKRGAKDRSRTDDLLITNQFLASLQWLPIDDYSLFVLTEFIETLQFHTEGGTGVVHAPALRKAGAA